jgi:hypothetical protein
MGWLWNLARRGIESNFGEGGGTERDPAGAVIVAVHCGD